MTLDAALPTDDQVALVEAYIRAICEPRLTQPARDALCIETLRDSPVDGHVMVLVKLPRQYVGFLVGRGGHIADGLRSFSTARLRALGNRSSLDLRVSEG